MFASDDQKRPDQSPRICAEAQATSREKRREGNLERKGTHTADMTMHILLRAQGAPLLAVGILPSIRSNNCKINSKLWTMVGQPLIIWTGNPKNVYQKELGLVSHTKR